MNCENDETHGQEPGLPTIPDSGGMQRYPTAKEVIDAALTGSATLVEAPTETCPNYAVPCEDLDGNVHRLVVVPLGGRVALVGPGGETAVLPEESVGALAGSLEDTLVVKVMEGM